MDGPFNEVERKKEERERDTKPEHNEIQEMKIWSTRDPQSAGVKEIESGETTHGENRHNAPTFNATDKNKRLWIVLVACGLNNFISGGIFMGINAVYLDILETFQAPRPLAALVPSLYVGIGFAAGVFTGPLMNWMGESKGMVVGSLLMTVGCIASSFAPSITVLLITFSCISGVGGSMTYLGTNVVVGTVFYDTRHLVLPLLCVCDSLGSTAFPFLLRHLADEYGVRGMFLIISGLCLQIMLCGFIVSVFRPIRKVDRNVAPKEKVLMECENCAFNDDIHDEINPRNNKYSDFNSQQILTDTSTLAAEDKKKIVNKYGCYENNKEESCDELTNEPVPHKTTESKKPDGFRRNKMKDVNTCQADVGAMNSSKSTSDDNFQNGSDINMIKERSLTTISVDERVKAKRKSSCLAEVFQTHIFHNVRYVLALLFHCTLYLTYFSPGNFLTEIAREAGLTVDQGTMLLTVNFSFGTVGRVALAVVQGLFKLPPLYVQSSSTVGGAISILCFVFIGHVDTENVYSAYVGLVAVYGFVGGIFTACIGMTCLELVEMRHFAMALGNMFFVIGISASLSGPLGGIVKDATGSYNPVFYLGLAQGLLGGAVVTLIGLTLRTRHKQPGPRPPFVETEDKVCDHQSGTIGLSAPGQTSSDKSSI